MQYFTIRDIENLTGIKAHTLRIWEQRYAIFAPRHNEKKHRVYTNEDLKKLLRVAFLYHSGFKISKVALLGEQEMIKKIEEAALQSFSHQLFILRLIEASVDFDESRFVQVLNELINKIGFEKCIAEVCYPFLERIGLLWVTDHIIPAQEHFSSYIIQNKIIAKTDELLLMNADKPAIVILSPSGEHHELPLLFIYYLLKKWGWNTIYLGTNIKTETLKQLPSNHNIQYFYLHIITNFTGFVMDDYFETLCRSFPAIRIIASGAGIFNMQRQFTNLTLLRSDSEIYHFAQHNPYGE